MDPVSLEALLPERDGVSTLHDYYLFSLLTGIDMALMRYKCPYKESSPIKRHTSSTHPTRKG